MKQVDGAMSKFLKASIVVIIIYLYFFSPAFALLRGIPGICILYPLIAIGLFTRKGLGHIISFFKEEGAILLLLFIFVFFRTVVGGESSYVVQQGMATMNIYFVPLCIILLCNALRVSRQDFVRYLLIAGAVGAVISCLCLVVPSLNEYIRFSLLSEEENEYVQTHLSRGFGIAGNITSGYPSALAVISCFGLFYGRYNKWFYLFLPLMVIAILINARTPFVILGFGILLFLFVRKSAGSFLVVVASLGFVLLLAVVLLNKWDFGAGTINWILSFFEQIGDMFSDNSLDGTTAGALIEQHVFFPEKLSEWIFGTGENLFHGTDFRSDVGFIRQLFYGGIIFLLLEAFLVWAICFKSSGIVFPGFVLLLLVATFILHFKGIFLPASAGFRVFVLLYYYMYYHKAVRRSRAGDARRPAKSPTLANSLS